MSERVLRTIVAVSCKAKKRNRENKDSEMMDALQSKHTEEEEEIPSR
jgi:hypothetical protein